MADVLKSISVIFSGEDKLSGVANGVAASFDSMERQAKEAEAAGNGLWQDAAGRWRNEAGQFASAAEKAAAGIDEIGESSQKSGAGVDAATTALKALAASLVVKDFIDANVAAEQFRKTLLAATGDATKAAQEFDYIREVSNRLGVEARSTGESYAQFASAVKGTALEGDGARVIFEAFAGTMSRLGASSADINGAFVQLAQGVSKGRFELEDLKSIAERVPGFFASFADALGVTTDELFKLVSAGEIGGDEILVFANKLNEGLQGADFDGFNNSLARLRNAVDDAFITLGDSGAFDALIKGVQLGTAAITGAVASVTLLGEVWGNFAFTVSTGDWQGFGDRLAESLDKAADKTRGARDALLGVNDATESVGFNAVEAGQRLVEGLQNGSEAAGNLEAAAREVDKQLKALGVNPDALKAGVSEIVRAFEDLLNNPAARGDQILAGLEGAIQKIKDGNDLAAIEAALVTAYAKGEIAALDFQIATEMLATAQDKLAGVLPEAADATRQSTRAVEDSAKAARDAEKAARDYALEMEKIASNERIKLIEARVALNVAQLEADTERVKAAFDSISDTINSTGDVLSDLFGLFSNYSDLDWAAIRAIEQQIDLENKRRQEALDIQKKLIEAQIEQLRAQTQALEKGDALIQVDGAGLQPHLEAIMWEILKSIQVRVNQDGLQMLLGL